MTNGNCSLEKRFILTRGSRILSPWPLGFSSLRASKQGVHARIKILTSLFQEEKETDSAFKIAPPCTSFFQLSPTSSSYQQFNPLRKPDPSWSNGILTVSLAGSQGFPSKPSHFYFPSYGICDTKV